MFRYANSESQWLARPIQSPSELERYTADARAARFANLIASVIAWGVDAVAEQVERYRVTRELNKLDDRMLADIGITRGDIPAFVAANGNTNAVAGRPSSVA